VVSRLLASSVLKAKPAALLLVWSVLTIESERLPIKVAKVLVEDVPTTSNSPLGEEFPSPTLPLAKIVILVVELVMKLKSLFDKVPIVPVEERVLPVMSHGVPPKRVDVACQEGILLTIWRMEPVEPVAMVTKVDVDEEPITKYP